MVVHESSREYWFFPRGRKDLGETLEAAALREAYEEVSRSVDGGLVHLIKTLPFT